MRFILQLIEGILKVLRNYSSILTVLLFQHSLNYTYMVFFSCYLYLGFEWFRIFYSSIMQFVFVYFSVIITIFHLVIHWTHIINIFGIIYLCIIYFAQTVSEWCIFYKYYSFISCIYLLCCCTSNCWSPGNCIIPLTSMHASM